MQVTETLKDGLKRGYTITLSAAELDAIEAEVQALVVEAEEFARNSPWPDGELLRYTPVTIDVLPGALQICCR